MIDFIEFALNDSREKFFAGRDGGLVGACPRFVGDAVEIEGDERFRSCDDGSVPCRAHRDSMNFKELTGILCRLFFEQIRVGEEDDEGQYDESAYDDAPL